MGTGADVPFVGNQNVTDERGWYRGIPMVREQFDISPVSATMTYGTELAFELDKRAELLGKVEFILDRGAFTGGGAIANDWELHSTIDYVSGQYGNKEFFRMLGEEMQYNMERTYDINKRATAAALQNGDLTPAQRLVTAVQSPTRLICSLQVDWEHVKRMLKMVALPNKIRLLIKLKPFAEIGNNITGVTIQPSAFLRCQYYHLRDQDKDRAYQMVNSTKDGVNTKIVRNEYHRREAVPSGTGAGYRLKLRNIKNAMIELFFITRFQTQLISPTVDLWTYIPPLSFWLEDNGSKITEEIFFKDVAGKPSYGKYVQNQEAHPDVAMIGVNIPSIAFCPNEFVEPSETDCFGSRNASKYNNLELVVNYDPADVTAAAYIDVYAPIHDVLITKNGDLRRYLA